MRSATRRFTATRPRCALVAVIALAIVDGREGRCDTIERADGRRIEGVKILDARWDGVRYRVDPDREPALILRIGGEKVSDVRRDSAIVERLRQVIADGDYRLAADILRSVSQMPDWIRAEGVWLLGQAYLSDGQAAKGQRLLRAYLKSFRPSKDFFVPHATRALADSLLASGESAEAEALYGELARYGRRWEAAAKLGRADAMLAGGPEDARAAERLYDQVVASGSLPERIRLRAILGKARALLGQGREDEAVRRLRQSFFDHPAPRELLLTAERAEAALLMGKAFLARGTREDLYQAELWLLRIPALYASERVPLAAASRLLARLYQDLGNQQRAEEWRRRADPSRAPEQP